MVDDFRCAPWTEARGVDPIGSATRFDRLVTAEVPAPWPRDVSDMDWLAPLPELPGVRVQAIVPEAARSDGTVLLTRWERHGPTLTGIDWAVPAADVTEALEVLVSGTDVSDADVTEAPPEILVCSHGARDRCCGGPGTRLAVEVRAAVPEWRVRRTSHLGGHRYAPTALTLPDGRLWAYLDPALLAGIAQRTVTPGEARHHYRGNAGLDPWNQVVEGAVLAEQGWGAVDFTELHGSVSVDDDAQRAETQLRWTNPAGTGERRATVEVVERYPVLQCGLAPDHAEKDAPAYAITG